jgi:hypothetical protein
MDYFFQPNGREAPMTMADLVDKALDELEVNPDDSNTK